MSGLFMILFSLIQALFSKKGKEAENRLLDGFTTKKEDLEVNWKEYYKYNL